MHAIDLGTLAKRKLAEIRGPDRIRPLDPIPNTFHRSGRAIVEVQDSAEALMTDDLTAAPLRITVDELVPEPVVSLDVVVREVLGLPPYRSRSSNS